MKANPITRKFPRITKRTKRSPHFFYDRKRKRWVIYRRAAGVVRKTSVRGLRTNWDAHFIAWSLAMKLSRWPADRLHEFRFDRARLNSALWRQSRPLFSVPTVAAHPLTR